MQILSGGQLEFLHFLFKIHHRSPRRLKNKVKNTSKGATRRSLQTRPEIIIKWPEYQIENIPEKVCLVFENRKRPQNSNLSCPTKFAGLTRNP
jgi:hypothetical protein